MNQSSNDLSGRVDGPVVQAGNIEQVHFAPRAPTALAGLPPAPPEFSGRERALESIVAALRPDADGAPVAVSTLTGTAGVGKTALVLRAAHDALDAGWFPGGVLFVNLQGYDRDRYVRPETALAGFLSALGVPDEHFPPTFEARLSLYRSKLAELAARRSPVLVVLDNASSTDQISLLLPASPLHRVLVSSRHALGDLQGSRIVDLGVLTPEEAATLITRTLRIRHPDDTRAQDDPAAVDRLTLLCGHLPLALAVAASILAGDREQSVGELAAALRNRADRLAELSYGGSSSVAAAFELSYARLTPEQARMFRLLSLNLGQQVSREAAAALAGLPVPDAKKLLDALRAAHMAEAGKPHGWIRIHDLLRLFAERRREETDDERTVEAAVRRLLTHYHDAAGAAAERLVAAARAGRRADEAEDWVNTERSNLRLALQLAYAHGQYGVGLPLAHHVSWFLRRQQDWAAGLEACDMAVSFATNVADSAQEALALYNKGDFLKHMKNYEPALHTLDEALGLYRRLGDRAGEAATLHSMGTAARRAGGYGSAESYYAAALPLFRELGDGQGAGNTLRNLGDTARRQGHHAAAQDHFRAALEVFDELGHPLGRARTLQQLGLLAASSDRPDDARGHWALAMSAYEEAEHPCCVATVTELLAELPPRRAE